MGFSNETGYGKYEWEIRECSSATKLMIILKQHHANLKPIEWLKVFQSPHFSNEIYKLYEKDIPWEHILTFRKIPIEYLEKHFGEIGLFECSAFQPLTATFIKKHKDHLSLDILAERDDLEKDAREMAQKLFKENNDPLHHRRWDQNLADSLNFCPKDFKGHYTDYQSKRKQKAEPKIEEQPKKEEVSIIKSKKPKKQKIIDYSTMKKAELKDILAKRNVRVFYHDTLEILIQKCKESEVS